MSFYTPLDIEALKNKQSGNNSLFIVIIVVLGLITLGVLSYVAYTFATKYL